MVELAERKNGARPHCAREQQELSRLGEVEGFIQLRATQFSMDDPMLAEDLAQEARERALRGLRVDPHCPYSHLVNRARDAIFRYRQKGKSVDGLLYHRGRARRYAIISFEESIDPEAEPSEETPLLKEVISDPTQPRRVTEERALANVLLDTLRDRLSPVENEALSLRLMGTSWKEVGDLLGQGPRRLVRMQRNIRESAREIWSISIPDRTGSISVDKPNGVG